MNIDPKQIPESIKEISSKLSGAGFEIYLVGGCVRDLLRGKKPKDWDMTTNAKPEEILGLFGEDEAFYENNFGTVSVKNEEEDMTLRNVEITPYRLEGHYSDNRRPDDITWSSKLEDDLARRDFTINAIAYSIINNSIVDIFEGLKDIKDKIIRAVNIPSDRFQEDALRMMRAIRLASELGFTLNMETAEAINQKADLLKKIAMERIQMEFTRIVMSSEPLIGINMAQKLGLVKHIVPELEKGIGTEQNGNHIYDVWEHNLRSLQHAAKKGWTLHVRLSALFHDVGKPASRRRDKKKDDWTFYGHEIVGERMVKRILTRLKYPKSTVDLVASLVRNHMFFSDTDVITLAAVRRIITRVGQDHIQDLLNVRICDRIGMGRPKEVPYRLRKYQSMVDEALRDPVTVGMLKIDGIRIMEVTREKPGPKIGHILHALLEEVLEDPRKNSKKYLEEKAKELIKLEVNKLKGLGQAGKETKEKVDQTEIKQIRNKHHVK
jgi:tRNA nucleotidyltransferase (CCA-adding enzyme)